MNLDLSSVTLVGLAVIGTVNVISMWKPDIDSRVKFVISVVVALLIGFVPEHIGSEVLSRLVAALSVALAASGGYKISQKIGGSE